MAKVRLEGCIVVSVPCIKEPAYDHLTISATNASTARTQLSFSAPSGAMVVYLIRLDHANQSFRLFFVRALPN